MSQFGTPSGGDAPSVTVAQAKVAFVPDQESLDASLQEVERKYADMIERVKGTAKAALEEIAKDTLAFLDAAKEKADAIKESSDGPGGNAAPPAPRTDESLMKLTEIAQSVVKIEANTDGVLEGIQALVERPP